jgi:hypothetical protein
MFMLWYGYFTSDGASALSDEFVSKYIGVTVGQNGSFQAGYRRIYIKYNSSLTIALTDPSTYGSADPYVNIYSQVDYYPGVAPTGLFPATRNVFHMVANDWAISTIAPLGTLTILPTVTGVGELESIYYFSSATGVPMGSVGWLEMPPTIAVDGTIYQYGGTEDFFGNQFYGNQGIHARADEYGLGRFFTAGSPDNRTYWTGYRYFRESPMLFNTSIGMTWQNSSTGNNPATQVGSLATYYTVS